MNAKLMDRGTHLEQYGENKKSGVRPTKHRTRTKRERVHIELEMQNLT